MLIGTRFDPDVFQRFTADASHSDRSLPHEVEYRASILAGVNEPTLQLISQLISRIQDLEKVTKKCWHEDLETWAAVSVMLSEGPIRTAKPLLPGEEAEIRAAIVPIREIYDRQCALVTEIASAGATVVDFAWPTVGRGLGMPPRHTEKAAISAIKDEKAKMRALSAHAELQNLDQLRAEAIQSAKEVMMAYAETEKLGRSLWQRITNDETRQRRNRGEEMRVDELVWLFVRWL
ncbi:hypothetical protein IP81_17465 [Novosphingobium sp. AAP83]|uniref:hypothetical protein n=1 Tax=Novosphingobium sp. AAP83 TaxID=1523425 RepID=UPI0006B926FC|nr:hypothetical protein [Novosphingobium sp. AAP83]KPF89028.1 hypothetical protein IP81_17465 [Novosphingobium sp. AAP83]